MEREPKDKCMKFSIITSVYKNDKPEFVRIALDSLLIRQSVKPSEVVLVQDGPVPRTVECLLKEYEARYGEIMHIIRLKKNGGLGNALRIGVDNAKFDVIARMDSDDISEPDRFEKQIKFLEEHPDVDVVGGQITEFIGMPTNIVGRRVVPCDALNVAKYMRGRCAINHPTVMFKKKSVLDAGNYIDWFWNEDYYLWIRMIEHGCILANLPDVLVNMRSGRGQYARRGGIKYFKSEEGIQRYMLAHKMISLPRYCYNVSIRLIIQVLMPNWLRGWVLRTFARKNA